MAKVVMTKNQIAPKMRRKINDLQGLAQKGHAHFKKITPKRSGNAKRRTVLNKGNIEANYPYAVRLDNGWSKQAPQGMVQPTIEYMRKIVKTIMRSN